MKFWEVVKAYQESGVKCRIAGATSPFRRPMEISNSLRCDAVVFASEFELEPQKIEVTREMLAKSWDELIVGVACKYNRADHSEIFKAFAESLGFK